MLAAIVVASLKNQEWQHLIATFETQKGIEFLEDENPWESLEQTTALLGFFETNSDLIPPGYHVSLVEHMIACLTTGLDWLQEYLEELELLGEDKKSFNNMLNWYISEGLYTPQSPDNESAD